MERKPISIIRVSISCYPRLANLRNAGRIKILNDSLAKTLFSLSSDEFKSYFPDENGEVPEKEFSENISGKSRAVITLGMEIAAKGIEKLRREEILATPLSPFDKLILGSCLAEQIAGNSITTINAIWKNISGNNREPKPEMRKKIIDSIERMSVIRITVNFSDAYKNLPSFKSLNRPRNEIKYRRYLLPCETTTIKINGQEVSDAIEFLKESPLFALYQYADDKKQVYTIPSELLFSRAVRNNERGLVLKSYVLLRINELARSKIKVTTILLSSIIEYFGNTEHDSNPRRFKAKIREKTAEYLEELKEREIIRDWLPLDAENNLCDLKKCEKFKIDVVKKTKKKPKKPRRNAKKQV